MILGYARVSTTEQVAGLEAQLRDLTANGVEKIFSEQISSVAKREELGNVLDFAREGDTVIVTRLDRLARSVPNLLEIVEHLESKKVGLVILSMGGQPLDTRSPTGKLMLVLLGAIAEFERGLMLQRQRDGINKAVAEGRYKGRAWTATKLIDQARDLASQGMPIEEVATRTGVSRPTLYRHGIRSSRYSASGMASAITDDSIISETVSITSPSIT